MSHVKESSIHKCLIEQKWQLDWYNWSSNVKSSKQDAIGCIMYTMELLDYMYIYATFKYPEMHTMGLKQPAGNVNWGKLLQMYVTYNNN